MTGTILNVGGSIALLASFIPYGLSLLAKRNEIKELEENLQA